MPKRNRGITGDARRRKAIRTPERRAAETVEERKTSDWQQRYNVARERRAEETEEQRSHRLTAMVQTSRCEDDLNNLKSIDSKMFESFFGLIPIYGTYS
ncbi:hypothetical protein TNCV_4973331 [Trichonephila clavipes]|uniref:Uncharacterized protein n=1 Tax=Trichonephila clavipes TaxID=2585209 RepID=A0A8X6SMN5_TRICX|nr:hypothetical protein TNCV_4973331 [Trichonephila clavipes]